MAEDRSPDHDLLVDVAAQIYARLAAELSSEAECRDAAEEALRRAGVFVEELRKKYPDRQYLGWRR